MTSTRDGHLTPEQFVDLLEGAPVEADVRRHAEGCAACGAELTELGGTLEALTADRALEGMETVPATVASPRGRRVAGGLIAAAAVAVLVAGLALRGVVPPRSGAAEGVAELLPPIESDAEYQLLLSVSAGEPGEPALGDGIEGVTPPDSSALTPAQQQRLVERLAEEMRSSS